MRRSSRKENPENPPKPEIKLVIVAFGDISGFGSWSRRIGNSPEQFTKLMWPTYQLFENAKKNLGCFLKSTGDGFMLVMEMGDGHNCHKALHVLKTSIAVARSIEATMRQLRYPRPAGFRVRVVCGPSWKWAAPHLSGSGAIDYLGYSVNLCSRLLEVEKGIRFICHESVKELIGLRQAMSAGLSFRHIPEPRRCPVGVDREDMNALWTFAPGRVEVSPKSSDEVE